MSPSVSPEVAAWARYVGLGDDGSAAHGELFALEAGHAGRVAIHSAGIFGRGRAPRKTGSHAADTLFVQREPGGEQLAGSKRNSYAEEVLSITFSLLENSLGLRGEKLPTNHALRYRLNRRS